MNVPQNVFLRGHGQLYYWTATRRGYRGRTVVRTPPSSSAGCRLRNAVDQHILPTMSLSYACQNQTSNIATIVRPVTMNGAQGENELEVGHCNCDVISLGGENTKKRAHRS